LKENKLEKILNAIFGDDKSYKLFFVGRSCLKNKVGKNPQKSTKM